MIRVFIGTEPAQRLACEVLKHSIRARTSQPVEFTEIGQDYGLPQQTGFSFSRWSVPELVGFRGRAIYMDADIVVLSDIAALAALPLDEPIQVRARPTADNRYFTSVMLMDCDYLPYWKFSDLLAEVRSMPDWYYASVMWASVRSPYRKGFGPLPRGWNDLDNVKAGTCALHYTDLKRQPWRYAGHPFGAVFQGELKAAMAAGAVSAELVRDEIGKGHVRANVLGVV